MAEWICRTLRDGGLEGEHAPALTINDTISCPLGSFVFDHILSQLSSFAFCKKSQSSGIVLVALSRSPLYYENLLKSKGHDIVSSSTWFRVLDCYTDPLGWKGKLMDCGSIATSSIGSSVTVNLCKNVKDLDELLASILELGEEFSGDGKGRFVVAIDSASEMLRHTSVSSVASLLSNLRSHDQVSSLFWLLHSDLHETRATAALEYMSSMKATIEQMVQPVDGQRGNSENLSLMEHKLRRGKFCVHVKRRNGRVRMMFEEIHIENSAIKFTPVSSADEITAHSLVPKVQFNLLLSEKERNDRANVVLPFEHQGVTLALFILSSVLLFRLLPSFMPDLPTFSPDNGKTVQIYDGRKSLSEAKADMPHISAEKEDSSRGEIIYFRDSDDEMPDSDEDPDDDLDI